MCSSDLVLLDEMDIRIIVHHVGEGEEMFRVDQDFVHVRLQGVACSEAFLAAGIHGGGSHNNLD